MIYFLSYGDLNYKHSRERIIKESEEISIFDKIILKTEEVKNEDEFQEACQNEYFKKVAFSKRGGGYYVWKPYIIKNLLKEMNEDDILVYTDCGLTLDDKRRLGIRRKINTKEKLKEYIEKVKKEEKGCLSFPEKFIEKDWTKMEIFKFFGVANDINFTHTVQYFGGVLHVIRKCDFSVQVYNEWWNIIKENPNLVDDTLTEKNFEGFRENRHDQSIWSILVKKYKIPEGDSRDNIPTHSKRRRY